MPVFREAVILVLHVSHTLCPRLSACLLHLISVFVQWLVYSFETQRNGLVFIYDMCGSNYTNFELDLGKKVLNLLKVRL